MADQEDQNSKTEEPSQRKLNRLRDEGNVPTSREVNSLFSLLGMLIVLGLALPWSLKKIGDLMVRGLSEAGTTVLEDRGSIGMVMAHTGVTLLIILLPLLLVLLIAGYLGSVVQNGFVFSSKSIQPNLEKISPVAGFKRLFSVKSLVELLKAMLKLGVIGAGMGIVFWGFKDQLLILADSSLRAALSLSQKITLQMVGTALALMVVLALADLLFQRMQFIIQNRMTRREMKEEFRDSEGDPHVKNRQRQIRNERARKRMMASVPSADVIITNPTHYSVALRYKPDEGDAAPVVVAKGLDHVAMRIREIAEENNIPLYEDPPLARQLYRDVEIDAPIPLDLYEVTAKVIAFVMQLRRRRAG
ncbi:MAG TPA: flagellar biosynthesis protein FlhB [Alphaproteobacteria bacterium]|nr:flagellar biosynthesis protein FlhB [Alphaproteobacteria bacterium]